MMEYRLLIFAGNGKNKKLSKILSLENMAEEQDEGMWMNFLNGEEQVIEDPLTFYANLISKKMTELMELGIAKEDIRLEWFYEFNGQCNLELSAGQLEALAKAGLALNISCWED